jgi:Do/DeqQ family serine protease
MKALFLFAALACAPAAAAAATDPLRHTPVVAAVEKVRLAVVNVFTEQVVERPAFPFGTWQDPRVEEFFRDFFEPRRRTYRQTSLGSGVIIRADGYVLTNQHVIVRGGDIKVSLSDERTFEARLVGADADSDLAVLKIDSKEPLPHVQMGDSGDLLIGETVIAIGNPFGLSHTVTTGVISAIGRSVRTEEQTFYDFIQTDASINPGNSGGPLLNLRGDLIGINTAIYQKAQGIGFATPINRARRVVRDLIEFGAVRLPWVGAILQELSRDLAAHFGVQRGGGVLVRGVEEKSPADAAGLRPGDVISNVGKNKVRSIEEYDQRIRDYTEDARIPLRIIRDGASRGVIVLSRRFPDERADAVAWERLGFAVRETRALLQVSRIRRRSPAAGIGLETGDYVLAVAGSRVRTLKEFRARVVESRLAGAVLLSVRRGRSVYHVPLRMESGSARQ